MNTVSAGYALICFDGLNLLIDQHAIVSLENMVIARVGDDEVKASEVIEENACEVHSALPWTRYSRSLFKTQSCILYPHA